METYQRRSPVSFTGQVEEKEWQKAWNVVLRYHDEGTGPFLIDLSHRSKWDIQDANLSAIQPLGLSIPETPGQCVFRDGLLISRMNPTQAAAWHLVGEHAKIPDAFAYTDVSDACALLSLIGKEVFFIMEKVCALDISSPGKERPFLIQGPVLGVPSQIVVLGEKDGCAGLLIACPRPCAQSVVKAILEAGVEWSVLPTGENAFCKWVEEISSHGGTAYL